MMGEKMANPPLVEAVCEFKFAPSSNWDWTIPGRLYDKISDEFSVRGQVEGIQIVLKPMGKGEQPTPSQLGVALIRMQRPNKSALVQVGPNLLAVNHLRPYPDWTTFRALVTRMFDQYIEVAGFAAINRAGLRYINQIPLGAPKTDLSSIVSTDPGLCGPLDRPLAGFYQRFELQHDAPSGILVLQVGTQSTPDGEFVNIDLDFGSQPGPDAARGADLVAWLDQAHEVVERSFIGSLNPECFTRLKEGRS
jgi:uncharacterized protein (TIGR04255 family)